MDYETFKLQSVLKSQTYKKVYLPNISFQHGVEIWFTPWYYICIWMYHKKETFSNLFVSPNGENTRIIFFKPRKFEPEIVQLFYFQKDRVLCTMIYFETNFFSNCLLLCVCFIRHLWFKSYCAVEHFNTWSPRIGYIYLN